MKRPRIIPLHRLGDLLLVMAVMLLVGLLILWVRSHGPNGDDLTIHAPGANVEIYSKDGRLIFSVAPPARAVMMWRPRRLTPLMTLVDDPSKVFVAQMNGWAVAVPHGLLVALMLIVPACWQMVWRERGEKLRRRDDGLCRGCGYDLRATTECCPECGMRINRLIPADRAAQRV